MTFTCPCGQHFGYATFPLRCGCGRVHEGEASGVCRHLGPLTGIRLKTADGCGCGSYPTLICNVFSECVTHPLPKAIAWEGGTCEGCERYESTS